MKKDSGSFLQRDVTNPNQPSSQFPSIDKINRSKSIMNESSELKLESYNEEYTIIQKMWRDLGVTNKYQVLFNNYIKSVTEAKLKNIFINERHTLKKFGESILKLSKEISARENNIRSLKKYVFSLINGSNYFEDENEKLKKHKDNLISSIISLIKSLRLNSVNVIMHFSKVRELSTYYTLVGKIDMKLINKDYIYDENYLIKMQNDMDFLNEPNLQKYFDMNNSEIDAFLTNFAPRNNININYSKINSGKAKIPVTDDLYKAINHCRFILLQEILFDNMRIGINTFGPKNNNNINYFRDQNNNSSIFNHSSIPLKLKNKPPSNIQFFNDDDNKFQFQNMYDNNFNEDKNDNKIKPPDKFNNMTRNLEFLRRNMGNDYNNLFIKNKEKNISYKLKNNNNISAFTNINSNNNENLFRRPIVGNQILIEREEKRERNYPEFKLQNNFINNNESPLIEENVNLNNQLKEVCDLNEQLKNEIKQLKKYVKELRDKAEQENKERDRIGLKKHKEIEKKDLENELKFKELDKKNENLNKEKNELNQEIKRTKTLMEKNIEENKQKINEINLLKEKQKEEYEGKIEEKNNIIKELNDQKDEVIREKNEIIKQKEQVISERDKLISEKANLEDKINEMEIKIGEDEKEIEKYKQLQIDYKNLQNEKKELERKIEELNRNIEDEKQQKESMKNESEKKENELNNRIKEIEQKLMNTNENLENEQNEKINLKNKNEDLIKRNNELNIEVNELKEKNQKLMEDLSTEKDKVSKLEEEVSLKNKELEKWQKKKQLEDTKKVIVNETNTEEISEDTGMIVGNYKYDFYRENLFNFIESLNRNLSLDKIPDFIKLSFDLGNINIFEESTYMKGVYPKIIFSSLKDSENIITGICSIYYENYGQDGEPLILRIEALCVTENDWDEQIINMIKFIKEKIVFDEIKFIIKYMPNPEKENRLYLNPIIKDLFKTKLNCNWKNITNLADGSRSQDIRIIKEGNYFDQEETNYKNNNKKIFGFNTLSLISLFDYNQELIDDDKNQLKKKFTSIGLNKYINLFPIFILLANNKKFKMIFANENDGNNYELPKEEDPEQNNGQENPKNQIRKISEMLSNLEDIPSLKEKLNESDISKFFDIDSSLCLEISERLKDKIDNFSFNYLSMNLNLSTTTNYCLKYENYYYNRISSKEIDILRDPETKNLFYLIPTKTKSTFILLCQVTRRLKKELLDGHKNIYQTFMEYHPKLTNQLLKFSSFGLTTEQLKDIEKTIYIPSFKIDCHLFSHSMNDINKKGNIIDSNNGESGFIGSIDEYFKMSFEEDKDIKNSFSIIPVEDNKMNIVIRESFLFGVFNINIIASTPLQLFYVTKDHWIKVNNDTNDNDESKSNI